MTRSRGLELREALDEARQGVGRFQRGDDAFGAREKTSGFEGGGIGNGSVSGATLIGKPGVFGADGGVIETGGNGMSGGDLAVLVLQHVGVSALEDAGARTGETLVGGQACGVFAKTLAAAARLDAHHFYVRVLEKFVEEADRVGAATDAGVKMGGQALFGGENLRASFAADDGLKIADHRRVGMRAENGAEEVMGIADVGDPVAHGFVDCIFEGFAAGFDADDFGTEHTHARDVEGLACHVFGAHVNGALQAEMRGDGSGGDTVLACTGFRDDARLAHFDGEQCPDRWRY